MNPADEEAAHRLGRRLGRWAWRATGDSLRSAVVVVFLSAVWHAMVPGMAFGAWAMIFATVSFSAWSCKLAAAALRYLYRAWRAAGRGSCRAAAAAELADSHGGRA
jgi:hypothetical protein